jgi:DNA-binding transcriptional LysR family regulator
MGDLDLNLLRVLVAIDDKRSVSTAAIKLNRSQPSVSAALGKLRTFFADPLFIRSGNTMQPTPRVVEIMGPVRDVLSRIGMEIVAAPTFEPASSHQPIVLALSDVGEVVFLPAILKLLRRVAPATSLRSVSLPAEEVASGLEAGTIDLALGYFPNLKRHNFFQQVLFSDSFTCLIRADHPVKSTRLSQKQFLQLDHAVVRAESRTEEVIERFLARRRIHRRVTLTTPHFASVPPIVEQSDLVVTVPVPLARYFSSISAGIRVVRPPFDPPRIDLKQIWHRKFHHDARNRWLRTLMCGLFQKQPIES